MNMYVIGVDDHDSPEGGCTTHFSSLLLKEFNKANVRVVGYPRLTRLNPNIPWKTRGNASVSFVVETERDQAELLEMVWSESMNYVERVSRGLLYKRSPGVSVGKVEVMGELEHLYWKAVSDVVTLDYVKNVSERLGILTTGGRGVIGSMASMGFSGNGTYELVTYRAQENWGRRRELDLSSLIEYDERYFPRVYANVDYVDMEPLVLSHGRDPVLFGLRGTDPVALVEGMKRLKVNEEAESYVVFVTNQGTDHHFRNPKLRPYSSFVGEVTVNSVRVERGGDCVVIGDDLVMLVYKETGELNRAVRELLPGDRIRVYGAVKPSVRYGVVIEPEKVEILNLVPKVEVNNPRCPICGGSSESAGKGKGFRCRRCGHRFAGEKVVREVERGISLGVFQTRKYRHLTKPIFYE
ncbi:MULTISPECIES: tRNA(Ile)(2)-agmatinylcytidine synthase [Metallosphaera]|uniref:tRNA(Ile2) 2-agmatinylcytidine synthetase TiaS n=3 Tax=Metallosphaera TaxID=41980 RepID=A4YJ31_METS5|nr:MULTISPECIES: tRNA(Ile)(2)-agmatinylcytidine synthase [Metallosphaera]ABP96433.1 tRNA(Ile2) 2-agmatinylcytidine synthetase [Metallosphaera sedula DSM 5348]AIM28416.1 tRNA(Ile2) 2-agmatinylcytidine synthetase [Metallosphaera sedula]AKV75195.1 tRNA(Ile2) 2-agmatinylcytidine synthetase TiaS [Metallosphaera sedula]AKV77431.1 tRNA(Ile2) 2-agmatinylcytidine synthetase TiaS [Metallosphaera sedula]AKV79683.1 tRNA(Ile2) 2-agmatinylcytidine synthetase TiaS [Metallosphaera sedula]